MAGALQADDGRWLMHCRPLEKHHGGLWEFPGGKIEPSEIPVESLIRELREELGIGIAHGVCTPVSFAEEHAAEGQKGIVILLYKIAVWQGSPAALEGGKVGWFTPAEINRLDKPPLDCELADRLFAQTE
ncbi:(deoxy)nucleoside triphosphate pyrophosphohydrolase [Erythrobacter rubeus]|uniref:(deoxy)nucleoside triphosphate pyrophosphohydrolase n=1 Tax=Erythrobacter rubeus TaxID=2760803 RepID=UPI002E2BE492|nr:(deoxy)nucleoside triphosphate pyrophosphohydrolase [Erythrobacter rubeus]